MLPQSEIDTSELLYLLSEIQRLEEEEEEQEILLLATSIVAGAEEARLIRAERRAANRVYLTRPDLLPNPRRDTPWQALYASRSDRAYITTMGLDTVAFDKVLSSGFANLWNSLPITRTDVSPSSHPRPYRRSLDAAGGLGLILHYLNSTMADTGLVEIFAIIPATVSRYIEFSMSILLATLRPLEEARIRWPTEEEMEENVNLVIARHPLLDGAFGSIDGLNLPIQTSGDEDIENATYNGWLHSHFISSVFAFSSKGEVIAAHIGSPGSWHDSRIARPIYHKLQTRTAPGYYLVADTAFPRGTDRISGRIRAPLKKNTRVAGNTQQLAQLQAFDRQLVSYRQTAEWGMNGLQGTFGRLRVPLPLGFGHRAQDIIETCVRTLNLRTRMVGHNQIRTVYLDVWHEHEAQWLQFENIVFADQRRNDRVSRFHNIIVDTE